MSYLKFPRTCSHRSLSNPMPQMVADLDRYSQCDVACISFSGDLPVLK
jgi:hypothetical protein